MLFNIRKFFISIVLIVISIFVLNWIWSHYLYTPWTRDGRVRANIITIAPDISGWVTQLKVADNQDIKKGEIIFSMDPERYAAEVTERRAKMQHALEAWNLAKAQYKRRSSLGDAISDEELDNAKMNAKLAKSEYELAKAELQTAKINLLRTNIYAPNDGTITNISLREGNYVTQGQPALSIVEKDSFYVTGYFEETKLPLIKVGQKAKLTLMDQSEPLTGTVRSIARGISNNNTNTDQQLLPSVEQAFTWVRLAQRIPVNISIDHIPRNTILSAGMTVSIELDKLP
ncbi:HlyD family secretion protein [Acinetobacter baumannii]